MKIQQSLQAAQSELGQHIAGVQLPVVDAEVPIPFIDYNFDNKTMLVVGGVVGAAALGGLKLHREYTNDKIASVEYPNGSDAKEIHQPRALRSRLYDLALASTVSVAGVASLGHMADPYTDESKVNIDSISIIVDSSAQSLAADVQGRDGETVPRIKAAVDEIVGFDGLPDSGITVTYIAAGTTAEAVATVEPGDDRNMVVEGFENYIGNDANLGTGSRAVPDLEGAIRAANAANSDAIFMVAGTAEGIDGSFIPGQNLPGKREFTIVALGESGSTVVDPSGGEIDAPINKSYNDEAFTPEDSFETS